MSATLPAHFVIWMEILLLLATCCVITNAEKGDFTEILGLFKTHAQIETKIAALRFDGWCEKHFTTYDARHLCSERNTDCQRGIKMAACCIWKRWLQSYLDSSNPQLHLFFNLQKRYLDHSKSLHWVMYKHSWMSKSIEEWEQFHTEQNPFWSNAYFKKNEFVHDTSATEFNDKRQLANRIKNKMKDKGAPTKFLTRDPPKKLVTNEPRSYKVIGTTHEPLQNCCDDMLPNDARDLVTTIKDQKYTPGEAEMKLIIKEIGDAMELWSYKVIGTKCETSSTPLGEPLQNCCDDMLPNDARDLVATIKDQKYSPKEAEMQFNIKEVGDMSKSRLQHMLSSRRCSTSGTMKALQRTLRNAMRSEENYESEPDALVLIEIKKALELIEIQDNREKNIVDMTKTELQKKLSDLGINYPKKDNKEKLRKRLESAEIENKKQAEIEEGYQQTRDYFLSFVRKGFVEVLNYGTPIITGSKEGLYQSKIQGHETNFVYKTKSLVLELTYEEHPYRLLSIYENVIVYQTTKKRQFIEKNFIYLVYESVTEDDVTEIITEEPFKQFLVNVKINSIEELSVQKFKIISKIQNQLRPGSTYTFETFFYFN